MEMFWAKVFFKEFIKHYRKMNDEQMAADVNASMDALEDLDDSGDSFGAKMVRWSMERSETPFATAARENGKKGGRPRKDSSNTEDARESIRTAGDSQREETSAQKTVGSHKTTVPAVREPPSKTEFMDWVCLVGIDEVFARRCYEMCERNGWKDKNGKDIGDWQKFTYGFVTDQLNKRKKTA